MAKLIDQQVYTSKLVELMDDENFIVIMTESATLPWEVGEVHEVSVLGASELLRIDVTTEANYGKGLPMSTFAIAKDGRELPFTVVLPHSAQMLAGKPAVLKVQVQSNPRKAGGKIVKIQSVTVGGKTVSWGSFATNERIAKWLNIPVEKLGKSTLKSLIDPEEPTAAKVEKDEFSID